mmetsp:Transcript_38945/g.61623  ORF Transcript_38945/g.61623 Transcript_38945/m.61623 type:complete len:241 (+) Transcript_38945:529-1251(+)
MLVRDVIFMRARPRVSRFSKFDISTINPSAWESPSRRRRLVRSPNDTIVCDMVLLWRWGLRHECEHPTRSPIPVCNSELPLRTLAHRRMCATKYRRYVIQIRRWSSLSARARCPCPHRKFWCLAFRQVHMLVRDVVFMRARSRVSSFSKFGISAINSSACESPSRGCRLIYSSKSSLCGDLVILWRWSFRHILQYSAVRSVPLEVTKMPLRTRTHRRMCLTDSWRNVVHTRCRNVSMHRT